MIDVGERALMAVGIGGQGIQLLAKTLAQAHTASGRHVMLSASYGGEMRGGPSQATVVVGDDRLRSLPVVPAAHELIVMHDRFAADARSRLVPDGASFVNTSVATSPELISDGLVVEVPATDAAKELGVPQAAGFVMLGAYAARTGVVSGDALVSAMRDLLPSYRSQHAEGNAHAIEHGMSLVEAVQGAV